MLFIEKFIRNALIIKKWYNLAFYWYYFNAQKELYSFKNLPGLSKILRRSLQIVHFKESFIPEMCSTDFCEFIDKDGLTI